MKKVAAILLGTLIASSAVFAQTNVLSRNAVGYVKAVIPANGLEFLAMPFLKMTPSGNFNTVRITNLLDNAALPGGFQVLIWDQGGQRYVSEIYDSEDGWAPGTNQITRGQGFFARAPGSVVSNMTVFLMGEVPVTDAPKNFQQGLFSAVGYAFPVSLQVTSLVSVAAGGDTLAAWTGSGYVNNIYDSEDGWSIPGQVIQPGKAFFYRRVGPNAAWTNSKPYTWPN